MKLHYQQKTPEEVLKASEEMREKMYQRMDAATYTSMESSVHESN